MSTAAPSPPEQSQLVSVRSRQWVVNDVRLSTCTRERETATEHHEGGEKGGWTVTPHWRRGHWRSQPCGPGRSERKRVAIPAVLVNGHLFLGSMADTMATYRVSGG